MRISYPCHHSTFCNAFARPHPVPTLANNKLHSLAGVGPGDVKESFYLCNPSQRALQELHPVLENGRDRLARFFADTQALANRLLRAMEIGLEVRLSPFYSAPCSPLFLTITDPRGRLD